MRPIVFGSGGEPRSINEGSADYWAAGTFWQTSLDNEFDPDCLAEWFSSGFRACLRRTDSAKLYPRDVTGEGHDDGEIWSSFLVALALRVGSFTTVDRLLPSAVQLAPDAPCFRDMFDVLLDADGLLFGGICSSDITAEAQARGLTIRRAREISSARRRAELLKGYTILMSDLALHAARSSR